MKTIYTVLLFFIFAGISNSQDRFLTKNGSITFFSATAMENIEAKNSQVLSIVDVSKKQMAIAILMKSFMFEKALMQEHFNENYVESDKYPKATFRGAILNLEALKDAETKLKIKGDLTIHGKTKEMTIEANTTKIEDSIVMTGEFYINLADFNIDIPSVVKNNIAKKIKVTFNFNHQPFKK